jgi:hypothetical protein
MKPASRPPVVPPPTRFGGAVQAKPVMGTVPIHAPPPTRFGAAVTAQAKAVGGTRHAPPPTRFGVVATAQAKVVAGGVPHVPPPTRFGGAASVQAKAATAASHVPPPTRFGPSMAVAQAKQASLMPRGRVLQAMDSLPQDQDTEIPPQDDGDDTLFAGKDNEFIVEEIITFLQSIPAGQNVYLDTIREASEVDVHISLEEAFGDDFSGGLNLSGTRTVRELFDVIKGSLFKYAKIPSSSGKGGKGGGWAMPAVRRAALEVVAANKGAPIFPGGRYTLHHKISRSELKGFLGNLSEVEEKTLTDTLVQDYGRFMEFGALKPSLEKLLLNMPPNLEIGPPADLRLGDPGGDFDPNPGTPRSAALGRARTALGTDFGAALVGLRDAFARHPPGQVISPPHFDLWLPQSGKFRKVE